MRTFFRAHWKAIVAIILLIVLATVTVNPSAAGPDATLARRLRTHVLAMGASGHDTAARREEAAHYIAAILAQAGYRVRRRAASGPGTTGAPGDTIEASVDNVACGAQPARLFVIGARYDGTQDGVGQGSAAVLELARLLKTLKPSRGTAVQFVFSPAPGRTSEGGSFIAFAGTPAAARRVQDALSAFQAGANGPAQGLAAPAYVRGVTLSAQAASGRSGDPAVMVTDTAFLAYPYHHTAGDGAGPVDDEDVARVVSGLARTITALAAGARM